jgi:hypothetical protein
VAEEVRECHRELEMSSCKPLDLVQELDLKTHVVSEDGWIEGWHSLSVRLLVVMVQAHMSAVEEVGPRARMAKEGVVMGQDHGTGVVGSDLQAAGEALVAHRLVEGEVVESLGVVDE